MLLMCNRILSFHRSDTEQGSEQKTLSSRPKQQNEMKPFLFLRNKKKNCKLKNTFDTVNLPPTQNSDISFHRNHLCKLCSSCCHEYNEPQTNLSCAVMAYFHRHANTSQNCLSPAIKSETRLKTGSSVEQKFYVDHHSWVFFFFFFRSSKMLAMVVMASINQLGGNVLQSHRRYWHWSKTGTVSDPAAMAFPLPLWKTHSFSHINPISLLINTLRRFYPLYLLQPLFFPAPQFHCAAW